MSSTRTALEIYRDIHALSSARSLLSWDQQVLMPSGGSTARSEHTARLERMRHELLTSDELSRAVETESKQAEGLAKRQLELLSEEIDRAKKLPVDLVQRKVEVSSDAYGVWRTAKPGNNFKALLPYYRELFAIAKETADALGHGGNRYDALINLYEKGSTYAEAKATLEGIRKHSIGLLEQIAESPTKIDSSWLVRNWDQSKLRSVAQRIIGKIGFDFNRGRLDIASNAFCSGENRDDIRMTTRPSEHFKGIMSSSLHEMGHALYEQNQNAVWDGTPLSGGVSLAVHESQSRTWENVIGRSHAFWAFFWPWVQEAFPEFSNRTTAEFVNAFSAVEDGLVRVGSDELHYNLHILIRFEIESDIVLGNMTVEEMPDVWNDKYESYFGTRPKNDTEGCLQDVHWVRGAVGYFPTYSYGNLIGAQIWDCLTKDITNTTDQMERGDFSEILDWLSSKIYQQGMLLNPKDLVEQVTGKPMQVDSWNQYARQKFSAMYGV